MSAEAAPPPTQPDSLIYKLSYTPLRDVLRGALTARLDLQRLIAESSLPPLLSNVVETTVQLTRLRRLEKVDVMCELIAHFREGVCSGVSSEYLADSFGNVVVTADLIRRAKTRQRVIRRCVFATIRRTMQLTAALLALSLIIYLIMAFRVFSGSSRIERDYVAEFNAPSLAIPAAARAWPTYRKGFLSLTEWPPPVSLNNLRPGSNDWHAISQFALENQEAISLFRRAAQLPELGAIIADPEDADVLRRAKLQAWIPASDEFFTDSRPSLAAAVLPEVRVLFAASQMLIADAYLGMAAVDGERVSADLIASISIAEQLSTRPFLISRLVAGNLLDEFGEALSHSLTHKPLLLTDQQLTKILARLQSFDGPRRLTIDRTGERALFDDVVQRVFTDNGNGDGIISPTYLPLMKSIENVGQTPSDTRMESITRKLQLPYLSLLHAGKRATRAKYDELLERTTAEQDKPLWEREDSGAEQAIFALHTDEYARLRYGLVMRFVPAFSRAAFLLETAILKMDAYETAIALELYHRDNSVYPVSLDQLAPRYMPAVPRDRYDGGPLRYKPVDGKPLLYSVGANREDDHGALCKGSTPSESYRRAFEWIPASRLPTSEREKAKIRGDLILWPPVEE